MKKDVKELTQDHLDAMFQVRNGATVYSFKLAMLLREVQKYDASLVDILGKTELEKVLGVEFNGAGVLPYFGAMLTSKGKKFLKDNGYKHD